MTLRFITALLCWLAISPAAFAHGDEDHGAAAPAAQAHASPRFALRGDAIEVVGVLHGDELELYVDGLADNAPLAKAKIEIEGLGQAPVLTTDDDGHAHLPAGALAQPGKHALTLTISAGELSDLFAATLEVEADDHASDPSSTPRWPFALLAAVLLAGAAGWRLHRRPTGATLP